MLPVHGDGRGAKSQRLKLKGTFDWAGHGRVRSSPVLARKPSIRPGRYCIRLSRVLTSAASWSRPCLVRLARDLFKLDQTPSTGFSSGAYAGSWKTVSHERAAISWRIARLVWVGRLSQTRTIAPPSC